MKFFYLDLKNQATVDNKYLAVITENGVWIRDEINNQVNIINAEVLTGDKLINVDISQFDNNFNLIRFINSPEIIYSETLM